MEKQTEQKSRLMPKLAFWATAAFTIALFARPNEIYQELNITGLQRILGITALFMCLFAAKGKISAILRQKILRYFALYFAAVILSVPFGLWPGGSVEFLTNAFLKQLAILFAIMIALNSMRQLDILMKLIVYSSCIVALHTIYQYAAGINLTEGYRASLVQGLFSDPNDLALHFVFSIPLAYFAISRQTRRKWISLIPIAVLSIAVLVTFSRGGMLGLCAAAAAIWYFDRERRKVIFGAAIVVFFIVALSFPASIDRLATITQYESNPEASMMSRWTLMKEGTQMFFENPGLGVGVRCFAISEGAMHGGAGEWKDAHNSFVQVAAETGLLGLIGFTGCLFLILKSVPAVARASSHAYFLKSGIQSSAAGYLVCALFLSQAYSWYFFYLIGLTVSLHLLSDQGARTENPQIVARPKEDDACLKSAF